MIRANGVMARRGRKPKTRDQKLKDALDRTSPNMRVMELRRLFSFVQPPADKRLDGRNGEIDSEVCDAIGQLCALGCSTATATTRSSCATRAASGAATMPS
jgi:hypothetical protein